MSETRPETPPEKTIRGSDLTATLFGGIVFGVAVACGVLNILAATGGWNPFHWHGRLWTGIFMIAAPSTLAIMAALPANFRGKIPDAAIGWVTLLVWVAFFWAACGGH